MSVWDREGLLKGARSMGRSRFWRRAFAGIAATVIASSFGAAGGSLAFADTPCATTSDNVAAQTIDSNYLSSYLTSYGVRAGSAGPDYLGISNTNFDFTNGGAKSIVQYTPTSSDLSCTAQATSLCALNIWGNSTINEAPNRFYANLLYNSLGGSTSPVATTWMSNPETTSWGDSNNITSTRYGSLLDTNGSDSATINGLEYDPDIIWGANKSGGWKNYGGYNTVTTDSSVGINSTNIYKATHPTSGTPAYVPDTNDYVNYDATNIWTQIYSMNSLASKAGGESKSVRYNSGSATVSANAYEKAIRGNLLYVAAELDAHSQSNGTYGTAKKTVAYLYAIDSNNVAYFFTPTATKLKTGNDTGASSTASYDEDTNSTPNPDTNYAANNATIDMGYMDTLPFITNTFTDGDAISYTDEDGHTYSGICMRVEDIEKVNPAVSVTKANNANLSNVDVIIYNTNTALTAAGTSGGKNRNGITNATALNDSVVSSWLENSGFSGTLIAGDDFGTSKNQPASVDATGYPSGTSPRLYCQRNYTADKNARAAWAFSMVYPELYSSKYDSYAYWVDEVYHVQSSLVDDVVRCMCEVPSTVTIPNNTNSMEARFNIGYVWWAEHGKFNSSTNSYQYYSGSSRASFYDGLAESQITNSSTTYAQVGIYNPSSLWSLSSSSNAYTTAKAVVDQWYSSDEENQINPVVSNLMSSFSIPKAYADGETRAETPSTEGDIEENNLHYELYRVYGGKYDVLQKVGEDAGISMTKSDGTAASNGFARHYELILSPIDSTKEATIPGFEGAGQGEWYTWVNKYGVRVSNNNALRYLQSVVIEEGITEIGSYAFTSGGVGAGDSQFPYPGNTILFVELPKSLKKIGENAFRDCGSVVDTSTNTNYSYPVTVTLNGCSENGVDGSKLEQIASNAFYGFDPYCGSNTEATAQPNKFNVMYLPDTCSIDTDAFSFGGDSDANNGVWEGIDSGSLTGLTGKLTEKASEVIKLVDLAPGTSAKTEALISDINFVDEDFVEKVKAASADYAALTDEKKAEVSPEALAVLQAAEAIVQTQEDLDAAKDSLEKAENNAKTKDGEIEELNKTISDLNKQISDAKSQLDDTKEQLKTAQANKVTVASINKATVKKADIAKYADATTIILGKKVKKIGKGAFAGSKVKTVIVQSKKLKKAKIKGCFKGAKKVKTIQAPSKKYKAYKKIFTKKITKSTKKLTVM